MQNPYASLSSYINIDGKGEHNETDDGDEDNDGDEETAPGTLDLRLTEKRPGHGMRACQAERREV